MIEKMYEENLNRELPIISKKEFPSLLRACRDLMGLKQYACSDYLGMENPRYKKLELGRFSEPLEIWEITRLEKFFKLPTGMLQKKQKQFLSRDTTERIEVCKSVWSVEDITRGVRPDRASGEYKRIKGPMDYECDQ